MLLSIPISILVRMLHAENKLDYFVQSPDGDDTLGPPRDGEHIQVSYGVQHHPLLRLQDSYEDQGAPEEAFS